MVRTARGKTQFLLLCVALSFAASSEKAISDPTAAEAPFESGTDAQVLSQVSAAQEASVELDGEIATPETIEIGQSRESSHEFTILYITETVPVEAVQSRSPPTTVDVYIAALNGTMLHDDSAFMFVTVYYGNGTEGDTLTAHVQEPQTQGVWKRPYSIQKSSTYLGRPHFGAEELKDPDHLERNRISVAKYADAPQTRGYFETSRDHRTTQADSLFHRRKKPGSIENQRRHPRKLRRRDGNRENTYLQFQPAYGQDLHTFVHIAAGKAEAALVGNILFNPKPKGDIYVQSVLEIPHAFRKWVDPEYAPLWDPEFIVTGDYWSSTLTPWYNTSAISFTNGTYAMAEGFYKHRSASSAKMVISVDLEAARHETEKFMSLLGAQTTQNSRLALELSELTDKVRFARQQLRMQSEGKRVRFVLIFTNNCRHRLVWLPLASELKCRTNQKIKNASALRELQLYQETIMRHTSEIELCEAQAVERKLALALQVEKSGANAVERETSYKRAKADKEASLSSLSRQVTEKKAQLSQLTEGVCRLREAVATSKSERQLLLQRHAQTVAILRTRFDAELKELQSEGPRGPLMIQKLEREIEALELVSPEQLFFRPLQQSQAVTTLQKRNLLSKEKEYFLSRFSTTTTNQAGRPVLLPQTKPQLNKKSLYELLSTAITETVPQE
ncbi:hypothetical protein TGME49_247940 [Toxoplasma gondii ME49]|uniref:Uncharacterized protein n=2 Tax=Toxoplasma gondii TaxID=5811 RepID=A0A125YQZ3_TOXGV|nr:hypothetical protein TGME49_247940 [Toxoplasma gondii ME49]EPT24971.1 hypothetical protein TGME49_247940 [Toxoplasma gondii ME49]ESS34322.1 hypothetical protein TGVEG_247940 [Toxoplasma gondii VEG]|eukprot:XP_018634980.1 hypothetical protein TGME49_247940 [Toxoplasma gondii ME49]